MVQKIIVGVDYGTTYSGVCFVCSTQTDISDIHVIRNWPGPLKNSDESSKTPSRTAFLPPKVGTSKEVVAWGFHVTDKMESYSWTKLLLDGTTALTEFDHAMSSADNGGHLGMLRLPPGKTARDVVGHYLREVYTFAFNELQKRFGSDKIRATVIEYWFTVPAIWSDKAKASTLEAARSAGFGSRPGDTVFLVPEPQAAAIATFRDLTKAGELEQIKPGDGILICDCGGGTVDITTYLIIAVQPALQFEELVVGGGGKCGSTAIDREFLAWCSRKFGTKFSNLDYQKIGPESRFMKDFETYKRDFDGGEGISDIYEVPLVIKGLESSDNYDEVESMVIFTRSDMSSFFQPVLSKLTKLLEKQIQDTKKEFSTEKITTIILVGGFGDSPFLNREIGRWCTRKGGMRLICPKNPQTAIVKGAALCGLGGLAPVRTRCRRHYGFTLGEVFREGIDSERHAYYDEFDGRKLCSGRMRWAISKTAYVDSTTFISHRVTRDHQQGQNLNMSFDLFSCSHDVQPERRDNLNVVKIGSIKLDFSEVDMTLFKSKKIRRKKVIRLEYSIQVMMGTKEGVLHFRIVSNDKEIGNAEIKWNE